MSLLDALTEEQKNRRGDLRRAVEAVAEEARLAAVLLAADPDHPARNLRRLLHHMAGIPELLRITCATDDAVTATRAALHE